MEIDDQLWNMIAAGLLTTLTNKITNTLNPADTADRSARKILWARSGNPYKGWITIEGQ